MIAAPQLALVVAAMIAFAANSLLCRLALRTTGLDAGSFASIRIVSGALALWLIVRCRGGAVAGGTWGSATALAGYMVGFSFAYTGLPTAVGALVLFGAVQATMIGHALWAGERLRGIQTLGIAAAIAGLVGLLLPGLSAPSPLHAAMMAAAGVAWGVYSIRGRRPGDPTAATAGNFRRAVPITLAAALVPAPIAWDPTGAAYAVISGALASGVGYALWYAALRVLTATGAATIQLCVPVLAAFGGVLVLDEAITPRLLLGSAAIPGGIALVIAAPRRPPG